MNSAILAVSGVIVVQCAIVWFVAVMLLRAQKQLLQANCDLTSQVIAFKNPGAAMLYAQQQQALAAAVQHHPHQPDDEDDEPFA